MEKLRTLLNQIVRITDEEWRLAQSFFKKETLHPGDYFIRQNEVARKVAFIEEGLFKLFYLVDGRERIMLFFQEHEFVSDYFSFLTGTPSVRPVQALEKSVVHTLSRDHLRQLYESSKNWERIGRIMAEKSYVYAVQRANRLLHDDYDTRFKTFMEEYPTLIQRAPQYMIASYLNMTPETLSRIKKRLYKQELSNTDSVHQPLKKGLI